MTMPCPPDAPDMNEDCSGSDNDMDDCSAADIERELADVGKAGADPLAADLLAKVQAEARHERAQSPAPPSTKLDEKLPSACTRPLLEGGLTLRDYQVKGLDWLASLYHRGLNGVLADEGGLGKTVQLICFLEYLASQCGVWGPHLVVVPCNLLLQWEVEFKKWCPGMKVLVYRGTPQVPCLFSMHLIGVPVNCL